MVNDDAEFYTGKKKAGRPKKVKRGEALKKD